MCSGGQGLHQRKGCVIIRSQEGPRRHQFPKPRGERLESPQPQEKSGETEHITYKAYAEDTLGVLFSIAATGKTRCYVFVSVCKCVCV